MSKVGYIRVSTKDQSLARQVSALRAVAPDIERIYEDKQSGKNFDRVGYQQLKSEVQAGDEVYVEELDRLGRNKDEIKSELEWFKSHGVYMRVLDVPTTLIDFKGQDWIGDMVNNILIEVLGAVAEQERNKILKRQAEGIAAMPIVNGKRVSTRTGRAAGRPELEFDHEEIKNYREKTKRGEMTINQCCEELGISRRTWYNRLKAVS